MSRFRAAALMLVTLASPGMGDTKPADCAALTAVLKSFSGYDFAAPPAGDAEGWCVLDGASLQSAAADIPDMKADRLRLRGTVADGEPVAFEMDLAGLRLVTGLSGKSVDPELQAMFRLQSADLRVAASVDAATETLKIQTLDLQLSGGTELSLTADVQGAGLSPLALAAGSLTALDLDWRSDGRLPTPVMQAAGAALAPDLSEADAIKVVRTSLATVLGAVPETVFADNGKDQLASLIADLPQGRGRLRLSLTSTDGIGAARLIMAGLADAPLAPDNMAALFAGTSLSASWVPGLAP